MEGTKHEKITLVVLGYIIGGVTVFIGALAAEHGYQMSIKPHMEASVYSALAPESPELEPAAVAEQPVETPTPVPESVPVDMLPVAYFDSALRVADGETKLVLSQLVESTPDDAAFANQGYHVETPTYTVSENGQFVFFCERHDVADNYCHAFVFDSVTASIYIVQHDKNPLTPTLDQAAAALWVDGLLTIGDFTSTDTATPWVVK